MTNQETTCRELQDALSEQPAGATLSPELQGHLRECSACQRFVEAWSGSLSRNPLPSPELMDGVAQSMRADLRPVQPLPSPATFATILAAVLLSALGIATYSMYPYGWEEMGALKTMAILGALTFAAVVCAHSLLKQMTPAARYAINPELLPVLVVGGLAIGTAALFGFEQEDRFWTSNWICLKIGLRVAVPTFLLVWFVLRKGIFLSPALSGATAGVLAGLVGAGALEVHCPNLNAWHILVSHLGVTVSLGAVSSLTGLVVERFRYRRLSPR